DPARLPRRPPGRRDPIRWFTDLARGRRARVPRRLLGGDDPRPVPDPLAPQHLQSHRVLPGEPEGRGRGHRRDRPLVGGDAGEARAGARHGGDAPTAGSAGEARRAAHRL
ncbi:MAG: hypothetical protein AVDCRST_MAG64-1740, partial [uncultured Phycisphaerae bacterium]